MAEAKAAARQRQDISETTFKVLAIVQQSPIVHRRRFSADLFRGDILPSRLRSAWRIIDISPPLRAPKWWREWMIKRAFDRASI